MIQKYFGLFQMDLSNFFTTIQHPITKKYLEISIQCRYVDSKTVSYLRQVLFKAYHCDSTAKTNSQFASLFILDTLVYSQSKLSVETILSQASTMVTFRPQKVCEMLYESKCSGDCIFCEQGHCISQMNFMRKSTICSCKQVLI